MGKYFGTDGFRGEAGVVLTAEHAFKIGRFLGWYYGKAQDKKCKVVIGKDTRRSSYMFEYSLVAGLTSAGADAYLMHVTTTPSVSYITLTDGFDCGIMISASHNPYYDNGIKVINGEGEKLEDSVITLIEEYLDGRNDRVSVATGDAIGRAYDYTSGRDRYVKHLIEITGCSFKGVKVGLDCANGASFAVARGIFETLGATTYVIGDEPTGFNINLNCGSTHIEALQKLVVDNGLNVGFAYDGDADRCLCVDEKGELVDGDAILYILGSAFKAKKTLKDDVVVSTVMSNMGLYKALEAAGMSSVKTAVGDKYVYEEMKAHGYSLGGEQSGHIIVSEFARTGDGMLTSLKLMEVLLASGKKMSELRAPMRVYPQLLVNVKVFDKEAAMQDARLLEAVSDAEKALGDEGRVLVRQSGTEPLVRVMVEASTKEDCDKYVYQIIDKMKEAGLVRE
ncbi:MAG: phosphoglucosamine mutase [Lachnospiraceae bacterium]|nr:phosphoglucosamine mutase [Lachnospiraceae bacterium]